MAEVRLKIVHVLVNVNVLVNGTSKAIDDGRQRTEDGKAVICRL